METLSERTAKAAQHTPGPWIAQDVSPDRKRLGRKCVVSRNGTGWWLAIITSGQDCEPREAYANAKLIAASPLLLEACQASLHWMGDRPENPVHPNSISAAMIIDALTFAIQKATGQP